MDDKERRKREEELAALLLLLFVQYGDLTTPDARTLNELRGDIIARLTPALTNTFAGGVATVGATATQTAEQWATQYTADLAEAIVDTTRDRLMAAIEAERQGMLDEAEAIREEAFGAARAESVGITETTRADTLGQRFGAQSLARDGITMTAFWVAERDGKVCPICQRMDGQPESLWEYLEPELAGGPPAHPNCRCGLRWEQTAPTELVEA